MAEDIPTAAQLNALTDAEHKVLENRLRRAAARQGLRLEKSRVRDRRAVDYCTYRLVNSDTNMIEAGSSTGRGYGLGLDEVARCLFESE